MLSLAGGPYSPALNIGFNAHRYSKALTPQAGDETMGTTPANLR